MCCVKSTNTVSNAALLIYTVSTWCPAESLFKQKDSGLPTVCDRVHIGVHDVSVRVNEYICVLWVFIRTSQLCWDFIYSIYGWLSSRADHVKPVSYYPSLWIIPELQLWGAKVVRLLSHIFPVNWSFWSFLQMRSGNPVDSSMKLM